MKRVQSSGFFFVQNKHSLAINKNIVTPSLVLITCSNRNTGSISSMCLCNPFTLVDPKSANRQSNHHCLFAPLGSVRVKAVRKTLVKLSNGEVKRQYWRDVEKANTHDKIIWDMGLNREGVI